ncbi:uncharacterized protein A1O9_08704 [Exophiala aquamarina CBS 119918]|uniref:FR47-like domain-containing protein n=1 Tax=Exophiala aquamarina CBS 119918 TaxID=1182545 RepID=A0A072P5A5_9EURO|nr:uncharacterized protein A1O9_08704 [Exophiala aquamarina CBS 119918]KEF55051.1 hypothetical protein A1O9_08704 [Exophiala aquamarina CBS 119918]
MTGRLSPDINRHSTLSPSQVVLLQARLVAELPYTLPLARRIEFHLNHPLSETSRIFVAAVVPGQNHEPAALNDAESAAEDAHVRGWLDSWLHEDSSPGTALPWLAAHIDLSTQGQTQVWVYASWEHPGVGYFSSSVTDLPSVSEEASATVSETSSIAPAASLDGEGDPHAQIHEELFNTLFRYIYTDLVPCQPTTPNEDWLELQRTGKYLSIPYSRDKVLFGTVHEVLWRYFDNTARTRIDPSYLKYVFSLPTLGPQDTQDATINREVSLPEGYYLADMRREHLQMVLDRTPIPRTLALLYQMESLGLFFVDNPTPIGWGFLSKDGSISSLHTEAEHRGRNLAVAVGKGLLCRGRMISQSKQGVYYGHADSAQSNIGSRRVMEKLGGVPKWKVAWLEIDLRALLLASK